MSCQNPRLRGALLGSTSLHRPDLENHPEQQHEQAWSHPGAQVLVLHEGRAPIRGHRLAWRAWAQLGPRPPAPEQCWLLGHRQDGTPLFLMDPSQDAPEQEQDRAWQAQDPAGEAPAAVEEEQGTAPGRKDRNLPAAGTEHWAGLREAALDLDPEEASWFTAALALARWHGTQGYCPACGAPTVVVRAGWARTCTREQTLLFPRTDPAVIAAVVHTDQEGVERILLGHALAWPSGRYSTFAGFVEAGESLENAVVREVGEEAGVQVTDVEYLGSQPWPFPRSLMLGFRATAASRATAEADGTEMGSVQWFTREQLDEAVRSGEVLLPSKVSIAHHLIADWFGQDLPATPKW